MKILTRDEFESLVTAKTPVAELPDGSEIDLATNQAIAWFEMVSHYKSPSYILEIDRWVFVGQVPNKLKRTDGLYQIGGNQ